MSHQEPQREVAVAEERGRLFGLRQRLYGAATERMLAAAHLRPGDEVLDIAAGTGDQSRAAARLVAPGGSVLATDISPEMLEIAARQTREEGVRNVTFRAMDAEQLDLPDNRYDAAISRLGLMLIPQRHRALAEIRRVLKPGGRLASLVWSARERSPLFTVYVDFVKRLAPEEMRADPFSLADAGLFADALRTAGFREVQVRPVAITFHFSSFEELRRWWGTPFEGALATLETQEERQRALEDVGHVVQPYEGPEGIIAPAELLLGEGMK